MSKSFSEMFFQSRKLCFQSGSAPLLDAKKTGNTYGILSQFTDDSVKYDLNPFQKGWLPIGGSHPLELKSRIKEIPNESNQLSTEVSANLNTFFQKLGLESGYQLVIKKNSGFDSKTQLIGPWSQELLFDKKNINRPSLLLFGYTPSFWPTDFAKINDKEGIIITRLFPFDIVISKEKGDVAQPIDNIDIRTLLLGKEMIRYFSEGPFYTKPSRLKQISNWIHKYFNTGTYSIEGLTVFFTHHDQMLEQKLFKKGLVGGNIGNLFTITFPFSVFEDQIKHCAEIIEQSRNEK